MQAVLVLAGLIVLTWGIWKLNEPWRKYHEEHIAPLEAKLAKEEETRGSKEQERRQSIADAELFTRNFYAEVRQHQKSKSEAYSELKPLRDRKGELHDEMADVRSRLDRWHRRSKGSFGNKGRKIKDDSILGWFGLEQTIAQKKSLENRRASISTEIEGVKDEISEIYERQIKPAKDAIKAAFDDQKRLENLRRDGLDERHFRAKAEELGAEICKIETEISRLEASLADFRKAFKQRRTA